MSDLAEWLLARIAEDETRARSATPGPWHWDPEFDNSPKTSWDPDETDKGLALVNDAGTEVVGAYNYHCCDFRMDPDVGDEDQAHIARWDPARVLAECEAKRRIITEITAMRHEVVDGDCWFTCAAATDEGDGGECCNDNRRGGPCDCGRDQRVNRYLSILALPYADRPGYREEWRP